MSSFQGNYIGSSSFGSFAKVGDENPSGEENSQDAQKIFLGAEVGAWCQLKCLHCIYHAPQAARPKDAQPRADVIAQWRELFAGDVRPVYTSFCGKEPTIYHEELITMADVAGEKSEVMILMTNGLKLRGSLLDQLLERINVFDISVDGDESAHNWMRRSEGAFRRTMARVEDVVHRGGTVGIIATAVHAELTDGRRQIDAIISLAHDLQKRFGGCHDLSLTISPYYDRPGHEMLLTQDDLAYLTHGLKSSGMRSRILWVANYAHQWGPVSRQLELTDHKIMLDDLTAIPFVRDGNLDHLLFNLTPAQLLGIRISNDGDVYLGCNHLVLGREAPNVAIARAAGKGENYIRDVVQQLAANTHPSVASGMELDPRCMQCSDYARCHGGDPLSDMYFNQQYCPLLN